MKSYETFVTMHAFQQDKSLATTRELLHSFSITKRTENKHDLKSIKDVAFFGNSTPKQKFKGDCYNCGKPGHRKIDCWAKGGGKESQRPNFPKRKPFNTRKYDKIKRDGANIA